MESNTIQPTTKRTDNTQRCSIDLWDGKHIKVIKEQRCGEIASDVRNEIRAEAEMLRDNRPRGEDDDAQEGSYNARINMQTGQLRNSLTGKYCRITIVIFGGKCVPWVHIAHTHR